MLPMLHNAPQQKSDGSQHGRHHLQQSSENNVANNGL